ncbi:MAG TPA: hypothetical protein ENJ09_10395 [Planctomycetes bacterium]|nr:hypothetical protein [Planctomycetota bacterium]
MNPFALLLPLLAGGVPSPAAQTGDSGLVVRPVIETVMLEGRPWYTVRAQNASALTVLENIARAANRDLLEPGVLAEGALVTVDLHRRPLDQVLEYTLGSLGLRYELGRNSITIQDPATLTPSELLDVAAVSWVRAARRFPDDPAAPQARLAQGEIAERKGLLSAARDNYLSLIEDYPRSPLVGEAYMRAGRISASLGQWGEAARLFRTLANSDVAQEYLVAARREWARSMIAQGDAQSALYMLNALATQYPPSDATDMTARRLVKASALNATGRYMDALEEIDLADKDFDAYGAWEALQIRAVALEGIGLPGEAARAWLLYAEDAKGPDQAFAYREAARLALAANDELAVLFVAREADLAGIHTGLESYEAEARRRLGLDVDTTTASPGERLAQAEKELDEGGDLKRVAEVLEPLYLARGALDDETNARVCVAWARYFDAMGDLHSALQILSEARPGIQSDEAMHTLDVGAAKLLEAHGYFEEAIAAYQGRYEQP